MNTNPQKQMVTITLDPLVVARLKIWIADQKPKPTQSSVVEAAIEKFLTENGG